MSGLGIDGLSIFTCADSVAGVESMTIDYSSADFALPPIITASVSGNVNVFVSDVTTTTAVLNFSSKFTGRVTYIIRPRTT